MDRKKWAIGDKLLFGLGLSLFGILLFVLVVGVIVALVAGWGGEKQTRTSNSLPMQDKEKTLRERTSNSAGKR
ncbi:hypothetical protein [Aquibacillus albus]|uniref:YtzI protein n=1 Tax=Aquibacillus albus TaxID=1168171 RepID=A0ABS2N2L1_9BACI|nr:hypothetical protein [Aquibacillus albus]MBM7572343.1 hypothetical protein [Aquibacillus albus]